MEIFSVLGGAQYGHFFRVVPSYVDVKKDPGMSKIPAPTVSDWVKEAVLLRHIWGSPNLVWSIIALVFYFAFPYDLSADSAAAQAPLSWAFFSERFPLWFTVTFGYTAFWHVTLYFLKWANRPFVKDRPYNYDKVAHNIFWSFSGVVIWVGFENVFAFLWATNRLPYLSDAVALSTVSGFARFVIGLVAMPLWRDFHFYFAHRLLHYKPMFAQVHSLHHRNTDIEPFAGLCMHPVEHLYYYACILPSLVFFASPFHFLWNGIHLLLAPGASHSGWEDHFQADAFHYIHHRYFDYNYAGANASFLDVVFDTFKPVFKGEDTKPRADAKSTLRSPPSLEMLSYLALSTACMLPWALCTTRHVHVSEAAALAMSVLAGFGPVAVAALFTVVSSGAGALLDPYAKRPLLQNGLHLAVGSLFCSFPIAAACYLSF